jgi:hypothetical protein
LDLAIYSLQSAADFRRIAETEAGARLVRGTHVDRDAVGESREGGFVSCVIADIDGKRARAEAAQAPAALLALSRKFSRHYFPDTISGSDHQPVAEPRARRVQ